MTDASVIVHGLEREGPSRLLLMDGDIHVPHLADLEVAQALRAQVSRGSVSASAAEARLARWRTLGISRYPAVGLLARVWTLRENLSAYDASYVALAEALECPWRRPIDAWRAHRGRRARWSSSDRRARRRLAWMLPLTRRPPLVVATSA